MIDSNSLAGIHNKQHARYYEWWRKYLLLKYAYRIAWGLSLIPGILQLRYHDLKYLQGSLLLVAFCLTLWWGLLKCPKCGERFYTGSSKGKCHNCGLSLVELSAIGKGTTLSRAV
jgi:hypothetical protein